MKTRTELYNKTETMAYKVLFYLSKIYQPALKPLHRNENISPFFIIGSGRSGNTLLRRILNNHSELFIPPETYVMGRMIKQYIKYPFLGWKKSVHKALSNIQSYNEFNTFNMSNLDALIEDIGSCEKKYRSLAFIIDSFYKQYKTENGIQAIRWGDKTPIYTFYLNEIGATFPRASYIHIIRNPYDAIYSYIKAGIYNEYEEAAERWKSAVESAQRYGKKHRNSYHELSYEELVSKPEYAIREVCKFLGLEFEDAMLEIGENVESMGDVTALKHHQNVKNPINAKSVGNGLRNMTQENISLVNSVLLNSDNQLINNFIHE